MRGAPEGSQRARMDDAPVEHEADDVLLGHLWQLLGKDVLEGDELHHGVVLTVVCNRLEAQLARPLLLLRASRSASRVSRRARRCARADRHRRARTMTSRWRMSGV